MQLDNYEDTLRRVLENGVESEDRTGTGTISMFGLQTRYNLKDGFPLITTKKIHWKSVVHELLWFIKGDTNIKYLKDNGVKIWDAWADKYGDLGPIYGAQWRNWNGEGIDQLQNIIDEIKNNPSSRRLVLSSWNPSVLPEEHTSFSRNVQNGKQALPPCHTLFQFYVRDGRLSCQLYQRSADMFLGVPFNIASYALLTHIIARLTNLRVGDFVHTIGDAHIYKNHIEQVQLQLRRKPYDKPNLKLWPFRDIDDLQYSDIDLVYYTSHPPIKGSVAV